MKQLLAFASLGMLTFCSIQATPLYVVTNLGNLGGNLITSAYAINSNGQVAGSSSIAGNVGQHAFFYDGVMHDLGTFGGTNSYAFGINDSGKVVGAANLAGDSAEHAFLFDGNVLHDLGTLGGGRSSARDINNSNLIV